MFEICQSLELVAHQTKPDPELEAVEEEPEDEPFSRVQIGPDV